MVLVIREESRHYSPKEIELAIRKCIVFSGEQMTDHRTGFTMSAADNGEQANKFVADFFAALKEVTKDQPEKLVAIKV